MNTLELADALDRMADNGDMGRKPDSKCHKRLAANELRRLHFENQKYLQMLTMASAEIASILKEGEKA